MESYPRVSGACLVFRVHKNAKATSQGGLAYLENAESTRRTRRHMVKGNRLQEWRVFYL